MDKIFDMEEGREEGYFMSEAKTNKTFGAVVERKEETKSGPRRIS